MGVWQPGVEGEKGRLDGKAQGKGEEGPELNDERQALALQGDDVKGAAVEVDEQDGDKHQRAAGEGVEEKLDAGVDATRPAPLADDEVHRDQAGLPEQVKENQVQGDEDADDGGFHQQEKEIVAAGVGVNALPGIEHDERREKCSEQDQPEADAVHAQVVLNLGVGEPGVLFDELHAGDVAAPPDEQTEGENESGAGHEQGADALRLLAAQEKHEQGAEGGQAQDQSE